MVSEESVGLSLREHAHSTSSSYKCYS